MTTTTSSIPEDHYGRAVKVGDIITSVGWGSGGDFPLWLTSASLKVVKVNRKRIVVTGGPLGSNTATVVTYCTCIMERDGQPFPTDRAAWFAARSAEILGA